MAPIAERLSDRYPAGILGGLGLALPSLGMVLLAMLPENLHVVDIAWRMAICGCGFGFLQAPNMKALMSSAPVDRSGSTSGMVATARLTGQTIGATLAAFCFGLVGRGGATLALVLPQRSRRFDTQTLE
jgi:MFS transporter, DHA2 family, multidrug resistance protein